MGQLGGLVMPEFVSRNNFVDDFGLWWTYFFKLEADIIKCGVKIWLAPYNTRIYIKMIGRK